MDEVPWPPGPYPAWLDMEKDTHEGFLYFKEPGTGANNCIRVTLGITYSTPSAHIWHMEWNGGREVIISPSIHYVGHFHTPNPVTFRLISRKEYGRQDGG